MLSPAVHESRDEPADVPVREPPRGSWDEPDASYTLDLYVGFIPATTRGLANRYVGGLVPRLMGGEGACGGGE